MAVASNLPFTEWGPVVTDPRLVAAIVDRLTFRAHIPVPTYAIDDESAIKANDGTVEVVSEGHWKLFAPKTKGDWAASPLPDRFAHLLAQSPLRPPRGAECAAKPSDDPKGGYR